MRKKTLLSCEHQVSKRLPNSVKGGRIMEQRCSNWTYERLVKEAECGDKNAKWLLKKFEISEMLEAFGKFEKLDDAGLNELASAFRDTAAEDNPDDVRKRFLALSDRVTKLIQRVNRLEY